MASRLVECGDGLEFLARGRLPPGHAIVTSLPDHSELPKLGVPGWREWFVETAAACCRAVDDGAVAIFYQTDVKHDGGWIDKGHLVLTGAERAGSRLLWHKIVCRLPRRPHHLRPPGLRPPALPAPAPCGWRRPRARPTCCRGSAR